jgi:hypothetical protein
MVCSSLAHHLARQIVLSLGMHFVKLCEGFRKETCYISRDLDQSNVGVLIPLDFEFRGR